MPRFVGGFEKVYRGQHKVIIIAIIINIIIIVIVIVVIIIITTSIVGTYRKMWDIVVKKLETADRSMPLIIIGDVDDDDVYDVMMR